MSPFSPISPDPSGTGNPLYAIAVQVLRQLTADPTAQFRDGQWAAISALCERHERALVVQRTGWGKSAVYLVATALRRRAGFGPTLLLSPLLSLMRDQELAAERAGVRAAQVSSSTVGQWEEILAQVRHDQVDLLLISPERLTNPRFRDEVLTGLVQRCGLVVVDEAHCISDWGHDFRPDYRRVGRLLTAMPPGTPVLATTATANRRVVDDVADQLAGHGPEPIPVTTIRGGLARESLRLGVLQLPDERTRVGWLIDHLAGLPGSGIVYTLTVAAADDLTTVLRTAGHDVEVYTGRTDDADRRNAEERLRDNRVKALVATSALGMGFDKPDLGFVVHLGAPGSPVAYYQQIGRAGRALTSADVLLLPGSHDPAIWDWFATAAMPRQVDAQAVLSALADANRPLSVPALESVADVRRTRLELLLKVLGVEGAVRREKGGWVATGQPWHYDATRYAAVAQARRDEQHLMLGYLATTGCRMRFLQECLDDATAGDCGRCDRCAGPWVDPQVAPAAAAAAHESLDRPGVVLAARRLWPDTRPFGLSLHGRIPAADQVEPGRAVGRLSDLGLGPRLREITARDQPVSDELVAACVQVLADWDWPQRPVAVAWIPSRARPTLVDTLARRIAHLGRLHLLGALDLVAGGPRGATGGNSAFRVAGVSGRFAVGDRMHAWLAAHPGAPVLLVDDLADSRWTLTVTGRELRRAGAGAVLPFVLAVP